MDILLISRCPPYPIYLGDRLIIYHLGRELSRRGHVIDLLAFADRAEDWQQRPWEAAEVRSYFRDVEVFPAPRRAAVSYLTRAVLPGTRWPKRASQSWSPEMWQAIEARLAERHYDVAHLFGGVQVYEFCHALGDLPTAIVPYESYSLYLRRMVEMAGRNGARTAPTMLLQGITTRLQWLIAREYERWMFTPYRRVVVVSERDRQELATLNPALAVDVISNGIDLDYFQSQNEPLETATLLFVGNYEYAPNVDAALYLACELFPQVKTQMPEAKLWLVGNAPPPELLSLGMNSGFKPTVSPGITVTGRVPDVRPYLAKATVFVSPLRLGAGIKNKVLEALAMGCPVAATPLSVDGIRVEHEQHALIGEGDALVDAIVRLLGDGALRERLSTNGRVLIQQNYSWARVADLYEQLYREIAR